MSEETTIVTAEPTPMSLLQQALSQNVDPDRLEKFMNLQERWEKNRAVQAFNEAMNACQEELPVVVRDRENTHTRSRYATLEAVNMAIRPVYAKHGFSISFNESECTVPETIKLTATVRHDGGHSEEFQTLVPIDGAGVKGNANKTGTQAKGSTLTYARRYLTLMIFNIAVADEDIDGNNQDSALSEEQETFLQSLFDQCEEAGDAVDEERFFAIFHLPPDAEVGELKRSQFEAAKEGLKRKLASAKKAMA